MLNDFITRIQQSRLWQQARTIWRVATHQGATRKNEGLDLFLGGASIGRVSALLLPGIGGPELVRLQGEILDDLREYTLGQEKQIGELKEEIGELRAALNDLVKQAKPEATPAAPAGAGQARKPKAERVTPEYDGAGDACCPKHHKVLKEGRWGLYCPAKDESTARGYCALKFVE